MNYTLTRLALAAVFFCCCIDAIAQQDNLTAQAILQRAIDSAGGDRLLESVNSMDMIEQVVTPDGHDTMYFAIKQMPGKYMLSIKGLTVFDQNAVTIYNDGLAVNIGNGLTTSITDPGRLELLAVTCYLSMDYAYKKLGFKLSRGNDQHYQDLDCYTLFVESPLGQKTINYYNKKTGHLLMIIYENHYKTVYLEYYKQRGVSIPSKTLMLDPSDNISTETLSRIDDDPVIDTGWFRIPPEGLFKAPAWFKTGNFSCVQENKIFQMVRENDSQQEIRKDARTGYTIEWTGSNDYTLTSDNGYQKCQIISWLGNKCYCQCVGSGQPPATVVLEKEP